MSQVFFYYPFFIMGFKDKYNADSHSGMNITFTVSERQAALKKKKKDLFMEPFYLILSHISHFLNDHSSTDVAC